jgi:hypothetical protein
MQSKKYILINNKSVLIVLKIISLYQVVQKFNCTCIHRKNSVEEFTSNIKL